MEELRSYEVLENNSSEQTDSVRAIVSTTKVNDG